MSSIITCENPAEIVWWYLQWNIEKWRLDFLVDEKVKSLKLAFWVCEMESRSKTTRMGDSLTRSVTTRLTCFHPQASDFHVALSHRTISYLHDLLKIDRKCPTCPRCRDHIAFCRLMVSDSAVRDFPWAWSRSMDWIGPNKANPWVLNIDDYAFVIEFICQFYWQLIYFSLQYEIIYWCYVGVCFQNIFSLIKKLLATG
jgi:hypothetical protein